jgi:hypothetical protein
MVQKNGPPSSEHVWNRWWKVGQKFTEQRFRKLHSDWKESQNQAKGEQAAEIQSRIILLGIAALPLLIDKISRGDRELVAVVSRLTKAV